MADPQWLAWCQGVNMNAAAVDFLHDNVGIGGPADLRAQVSLTEFPGFLKTVSKQILSITPAQGAARPLFPWGAQKALHALRMYTEYRNAADLNQDDDIILTNFTGNRRIAWLGHLEKIKQREQDTSTEEDPIVVPKLRSLSRWVPFKEMVTTKLQHQYNPTLGHRLIYLLRDYEVADNEQVNAHYDSIEERIEATVDLDGPLFKRDNTWLYSFLKGLVVEGDVWTYIQALDSTQDGRKAWQSIKDQAEGPAAIKLRISTGYAKMQNTKYTGKSKKFNFQSYIRAHTQAHNMVTQDTEEVLTQSKKVDDFLNGIEDPNLAAAVNAVRASTEKMETFEKASQHILEIYLKQQQSKPGTNADYSVAAVDTDSKPSPKKGKGGTTSKKSKSFQTRLAKAIKEVKNNTFKFAANDVYNSKEFASYRNTIQQRRKAKAAAAGKNATPGTDRAAIKAMFLECLEERDAKANRNVGAVKSGEEEEGEDTTPKSGTVDEYEAAEAASASSQFGRRGRNNKKRSSESSVNVSSVLTAPIPKKTRRASLQKVMEIPVEPSIQDPQKVVPGKWRERLATSAIPNIEYHNSLRELVLGPDKPTFRDKYEELLALGSTHQALKFSWQMKTPFTDVEAKRFRWLEHKFKTIMNNAGANEREDCARLAAWMEGQGQSTYYAAKRAYNDALKVYDKAQEHEASQNPDSEMQMPDDLENKLQSKDFACMKRQVQDTPEVQSDADPEDDIDLSDEDDSSDEENEFEG